MMIVPVGLTPCLKVWMVVSFAVAGLSCDKPAFVKAAAIRTAAIGVHLEFCFMRSPSDFVSATSLAHQAKAGAGFRPPGRCCGGSTNGWQYEVKFDGYRALAIKSAG